MAGWPYRIARTPTGGLIGVAVTVLGTLAGCAGSESVDHRPSRPNLYPYLEVASNEPQNLARIRADAGVDGLILAFVVAGGRRCRPAWSRGGEDVAAAEITVRVNALRRAGGPIWISFGGAGGPDLAQVCDSVEELTAAYRAVVDAYRPDGIDLDVEGRALADRVGSARRVAAIAALQRSTAAQGTPLRVSYTLPAAHEGIPREGVELLKESIAAGIAVTAVNVMIMNYGWGVADLGDEGVRQAGLAQTLVRRLWPGLSDRQAWRRVALTAMVGRNDVPGEIFHPADARTVAQFAGTRGIGRLSYWSVERDRRCARPPPAQPSWRCSGVTQRPYEFAGVLRSPGR